MSQKQQLKDSEYHLSKRDVKKIVNAATNFRDRCMLKTFAQTAIRRFELGNLDIRMLPLRGSLFIFGRAKEARQGRSRRRRTCLEISVTC